MLILSFLIEILWDEEHWVYCVPKVECPK